MVGLESEQLAHGVWQGTWQVRAWVRTYPVAHIAQPKEVHTWQEAVQATQRLEELSE